MKSHWIKKIAMLGVLFCLAINVKGADYERTKDVIYGRKHGVALTMDVITPAKQNNRGVIFAVSGGWFSSHDNIDKVMDRGTFLELLKRGYTVFAVVHGSQPKFTVPEILEDMHRAVRFIRHHAELYKIDPANIGMFGGSAGGHLTLLQGTDGQDGDPSAEGPVDRESSAVQAIVSYFPPTDFLNYGKKGQHFDKLVLQVMFGRNPFLAALDFRKFDKEKQLIVKVEDQGEIKRLLKEVSPVTHVNKGDAPTLLIHGDADLLVPIQQSKLILSKFKQEGVEAELLTMAGKNHGWKAEPEEIKRFGDWFDKHLLRGE